MTKKNKGQEVAKEVEANAEAEVSTELVAAEESTTETQLATTTDESGEMSKGALFLQKIKAEEESRNRSEPHEQFVERVVNEHSEDAGHKYFNLLATMVPTDPGETWFPTMIGIAKASAKKPENKELVRRIGDGSLFFYDSKKRIPDGTLFFPLMTHVENSWWVEGRKECASIDGEYGEGFDGVHKGMLVKCGSQTCPQGHKPGQFDKSDAFDCKWSRQVYVVDSNLTDIYQLPLKYFSVKLVYETMRKATKFGGQKFIPKNNNWFTLNAEESGKGDRVNWYLQARETDAEISPEDVELINQLRKWMHEWQLKRIEERDSKFSNVSDAIDSIPVDAEPLTSDSQSAEGSVTSM